MSVLCNDQLIGRWFFFSAPLAVLPLSFLCLPAGISSRKAYVQAAELKIQAACTKALRNQSLRMPGLSVCFRAVPSLAPLSYSCLPKKKPFRKAHVPQLELLAHGLHKMAFSDSLVFCGLLELPRLFSHCLQLFVLKQLISRSPCASNSSC